MYTLIIATKSSGAFASANYTKPQGQGQTECWAVDDVMMTSPVRATTPSTSSAKGDGMITKKWVRDVIGLCDVVMTSARLQPMRAPSYL